jgi:hypothetical protein
MLSNPSRNKKNKEDNASLLSMKFAQLVTRRDEIQSDRKERYPLLLY